MIKLSLRRRTLLDSSKSGFHMWQSWQTKKKDCETITKDFEMHLRFSLKT
jgi:hypothetical protein